MGKFEVHHVNVGKNCTLKALSRVLHSVTRWPICISFDFIFEVQSGATMSDNSALLEHTLLLMGDTLPSGKEYQGWPYCRIYERVDKRRVITQSDKLGAQEIKMVVETSVSFLKTNKMQSVRQNQALYQFKKHKLKEQAASSYETKFTGLLPDTVAVISAFKAVLSTTKSIRRLFGSQGLKRLSSNAQRQTLTPKTYSSNYVLYISIWLERR